MEDKIIIGKRGKSYLGKSTYIFNFVISFILFFFSFLFLTFLFIGDKNPAYIVGFIFGVICFLALSIIFLFFGLYRVKISKKNDECEKECLEFLSKENLFVFQDIFNDKEIKVKPEQIERIYGSKVKTNNELYVFYKDEKGKVIKVNLGYCSNIEHESFNNELMKIINPADVGL